ncbi:UDP-N-acetylmuramate:L-alanyl-gamma-D-glutamyl-meso-diaminopimelate ligase [Marinagarivorans algicola]|uniref:UDP-N-acetylmuramate:L-alanyl-gamma-D-glutamyl- meso-diaminopimelate ligase n=1 Tax=Marinagarivorans algicola TaxID=1513270 RepID=UPI0006B59121|nr:UDP-N-acetylmuramate:L-alanyl-gamma-D-glutamyl-meso-diaminopimelate ligase [Marinagarivorans algicola]
MQHIHILGICGTFMGSLAQLAKAQGYRVTGSDVNVYPPMSTQLEAAGIDITQGWGLEQLTPVPDMIVVGNVISRGNPLLEAILNRMLPFTSGPQWLAEHVLQGRWVMAVAGTHGKTTTASMLACMLECADMAPGFLIGGVPKNFGVSARLGDSDFFVIEADEYDSAFFDKRSKFVHYRPHTLVLNNLEYDHADIFPDLAAIERQFHHVVRTVPQNGLLVAPNDNAALKRVFAMGQYTPMHTFNGNTQSTVAHEADWQAHNVAADGSYFDVYFEGKLVGAVQWGLTGLHSVNNALAAIAAARHVGVEPIIACEALAAFESVKRRMELLAHVKGIKIYDDFAHHPTAIKTTLQGLRAQVGDAKITAVIEPRSNTMKQGVHKQQLLEACEDASQVCWYQPTEQGWSLRTLITPAYPQHHCFENLQALMTHLIQKAEVGEHIVIMSNGSFGGIHQMLIRAISGTP